MNDTSASGIWRHFEIRREEASPPELPGVLPNQLHPRAAVGVTPSFTTLNIIPFQPFHTLGTPAGPGTLGDEEWVGGRFLVTFLTCQDTRSHEGLSQGVRLVIFLIFFILFYFIFSFCSGPRTGYKRAVYRGDVCKVYTPTKKYIAMIAPNSSRHVRGIVSRTGLAYSPNKQRGPRLEVPWRRWAIVITAPIPGLECVGQFGVHS